MCGAPAVGLKGALLPGEWGGGADLTFMGWNMSPWVRPRAGQPPPCTRGRWLGGGGRNARFGFQVVRSYHNNLSRTQVTTQKMPPRGNVVTGMHFCSELLPICRSVKNAEFVRFGLSACRENRESHPLLWTVCYRDVSLASGSGLELLLHNEVSGEGTQPRRGRPCKISDLGP